MAVSVRDGSVGGELLGGSARRVRQYPVGRVCSHDGCGTRLSVYNSRPCCSCHDFDPRAGALPMSLPVTVAATTDGAAVTSVDVVAAASDRLTPRTGATDRTLGVVAAAVASIGAPPATGQGASVRRVDRRPQEPAAQVGAALSQAS